MKTQVIINGKPVDAVLNDEQVKVALEIKPKHTGLEHLGYDGIIYNINGGQYTTKRRDTLAGEGVASTKDAPEGYKVNPLYIEKRSKRLQLLVQPSLYDKVKAQAETEGCSVNDYIHRVLEEALRGE